MSRNILREAIQPLVHTGRLQTKQGQTYEKADIQLHKAILEASHNSMLIDLYDHMIDSLHTSCHHIVEVSSHADFYLNLHCKLVDAIMAIYTVNEYITQI
ncbi:MULTISPECIES: FCD domain-containing protein [Priestia]|uniref:Transcriptional regulator, GntR family n=1 Tax=Priestia megaterium (strain ATCC 12872 / QMB1551) TaxID=545693 RepID=D5E442_PRIM1|nr:transcriptional regulator, GntR family [Priestia megaterium QM B1551]